MGFETWRRLAMSLTFGVASLAALVWALYQIAGVGLAF
jgi:hypothetical protein